jgi:hypothetical protein
MCLFLKGGKVKKHNWSTVFCRNALGMNECVAVSATGAAGYTGLCSFTRVSTLYIRMP